VAATPLVPVPAAATASDEQQHAGAVPAVAAASLDPVSWTAAAFVAVAEEAEEAAGAKAARYDPPDLDPDPVHGNDRARVRRP